MANTEGLTDEDMLKSMNETVVRGWSQSTDTRTSSLAQRLDVPLGGRPAAKVIRKSPAKIAKPKGTKYLATPSEVPSSSETREEEQQAASRPVLGNVVERKHTRKNKAATARPTPHPRQGFPSLQKPLGTFTPKNTTKTPSFWATKTTESAASSAPSIRNTTATATATTPSITTNDINALKQASAKDAENMLAGMSAEEIRASAQELQAFMSAESLAFLSNRNKQKQPSTTSSSENNRPKQPKQPTISKVEQERLEKERIAQLLSSVKTYQDMDAVYQAEMGEAADFIKEDPTSDPFLVACDLLRSTSPRQNLWAVRTVRDCLAADYQKGKCVRLNNAANPQAWPYPTLLPVSLRCLLDQTPNWGNQFILHTYALESLYLLLRLRCAEYHDIDLTSLHVNDPNAVYPLIFAEDAVPSPPMNTVYKASSVSPLSVGQYENVAYATASSSESATQDGQKFTQDPLWTLLSNFRIIPLFSTLFRYQEPNKSLPEEAWQAALGILSMLAQRSPGAATAMVQHKTLLKDVARVAWDDSDAWGDQCNAPMNKVLSVVRLWVILARQSRTAASELELPPWGMLLGAKQSSETGRQLQRWTLVLWRTLLRYGLALHEFEAMLTLSASHMSILNTESPLVFDYLSCWTLVLNIHHARILKAADDAILEHETRQMVKVRSWLKSWYRECLAFLAKKAASSTSVALAPLAACLRFCRRYIFTAEDVTPNPPGEYKNDESTIEDEITCTQILQQLVDSAIVGDALSIVAPTLFQNTAGASNVDEAAAVRFLADFTSTLRMMQERADEHGSGITTVASLANVFTALSETLFNVLSREATRKAIVASSTVTPAVLGWHNPGRFVCLELVRLTSLEKKIDPVICIAMGASTLASMQVGDEAMVDRLLRMEAICFPLVLRSTILGQLRTGQQKELQIQHSASLNSTFLRDESVAIDLLTLRSEADNIGPRRDDANDAVLPLDKYFLWNILAGSASPDTPLVEVVEVLTATLSLLNQLEEASRAGICRYAESLMDGSKMYFLMNVCLQHEDVLGEEAVETLCSSLRRHCLRHVDADFVSSFADSCVGHALVQFPGASAKDDEGGDATLPSEDEKKLADAVLEEKEDPGNSVSGKRLRIVIGFVGDLCTAFCDYGAQYSFFGTCFRVFLYPSFPSKIRCEVLSRLQGLLHLLALPDDDKDPAVLSKFLAVPQADGSTLDALASCFHRSSPGRSQGFVEDFAVASLAMSLGAATRTKGAWDLQQRRLRGLQPVVLARVARAARFHMEQQQQDCGTLELSKFILENASVKEEMTWDHVAGLFSL